MNNSIEDSWFDLAAELGVETPKPAPAPPQPEPEPEMLAEEPPPVDLVNTLFDTPLPDAAEAESDTEIIEAGGDTEADRKRKRRRRRKKRTEGGADAGPEEPEATSPAEEEAVTQPRELLREIIRNWDVPGWDEIISGLHRPHR